ncbi:hypothetical protein G6F68_015857 [Rhizopus microsporus]|nr:hypothetical protein G6F68_015857 [Rhizopus microsporus]
MFSLTLHRAVGALFAITALTAASTAIAADAWKPTKPVRLLVGFAPGGSADTLARLLAEPLSQRLGQTVVVENLAGAGGNIMAFRLSQSPADGYTIGYAHVGTLVLHRFLFKQQLYDLARDVTPIGLVAETPNVIVVNAASPYRDLKSFIDASPKSA